MNWFSNCIIMRVLNKYIAVVLVLFNVCVVRAQMNEVNYAEVRQYLNSMFQPLNKQLVPTGILLDYGIEYVDLADYDGTILADSTVVNIGIYRDIIKTLSSADVRSSNLYNSVKPQLDNFETQKDGNNVLLSAIIGKYNQIKANALEDNLIYYDEVNNKVSDVYKNGQWVNPYDTKYLFAFVANTESCNSLTVNYTLPENLFFKSTLFTGLAFDAGDGAGYRDLAIGSTISVTYDSSGEKILRLKLREISGRTLETHTKIHIENDIDVSILNTSGLLTKEYTTSAFNGETVTARIVYKIPSQNAIQKPFIVVEGFDPWQALPLMNKEAVDYPNNHTYAGFTHYNSYVNWFRELENIYGYNVIYVDWKNSEADIRANACLLQDIIKDINYSKYTSGSSEKNVVCGLSMGGLVARYALRDMELNNELHEVDTYISGDTPHLGVNVPIGFQMFINQLLSFVHGYTDVVDILGGEYDNILSPNEKLIKQQLTSPAARQMMYCYVEGDQIIDSEHLAWQQEINAMGFPQGDEGCKIELITMANNSSYLYRDDLIYDDNILKLSGYAKARAITDIALAIYGSFWNFDANYRHIEEIISTLGSNSINIDAEVNLFSAANRGKTLSKLVVTYTKRFLWIGKPKKTTLFSSNMTVPYHSLYYEDFPGSLYRLDRESNHKYIAEYDKLMGKYNYELKFKTLYLFVPTASALNVYQSQNATSTNDYKLDFINRLFLPNIDIPFDAYHIDLSVDENTNTAIHIMFSENALNWLINQMDMEINGPDFVPLKNENVNVNGVGQYYVSGLNDVNAEINWYVSDASIATINRATGELTAVSNGIVEVTARSNIGSNIYQKTKKVYIGFPDFVIKNSYVPGYGYKFTARLTDDTNVSLSDINETAGLYYRWYTVNSDGECVSVDESQIDENSYSFLPSQDEVITVVLRLEDDYGNCSPIRSVTVNLTTPFETNYNYIVIDKWNNLHCMKNLIYSLIQPYEDFAISFRGDALNESDDSMSTGSMYIKGDQCYLSCRNVNSQDGLYVVGNKVEGELKWSYNLIDISMFDTVITEAQSAGYDSRQVIAEYELIIMNSMIEVMQRVPFKIIYNPNYQIYTPVIL